MPDSSGVTRRTGLRTAVAAAVAMPLLTRAQASVASATRRTHPRPRPRLDVMTYNLRYASTVEPNSWAVRRPVMRELLRGASPHVIGTQEGLFRQLLDIESDLAPHYAWIGSGREGVSGDESVAVFYDTRRLAPVGHDTFQLSDTPRVTGSNTWGAALPRIATWGRFRDLADGGREFHILNTHLDHASQYARTRAASLIAERIAEFDPSLPRLVTGDFNAAAHRNEVYDILLGAELADTWDTAAARSRLYATFHGYAPLTPDGDRIDWILASPGVKVHRASIDTFSRYGRFPSDHLPVRASLTLG
ncbi:endonuclease/exonuclease/phosphatase family protein [Streptomyces sp. NPDC086182]|uniref:endonuclease/exonuclease/phosphatase family protein n=1 Tax=Streptomyces sp. NPDC086182 TaxID=3155058 RepID=UPI003418F20D